MRLFLIAAMGLALAACTPPSADKPAVSAPAAAPGAPAITLPPMSDNPRDALLDCAAAAAAKGNVDTAAKEPSGPDTAESTFYWTMMALLDKEAMPPEARRTAIEALKKTWGAANVADLDARLTACRAKFTAQ
jgi:hypothetical protein